MPTQRTTSFVSVALCLYALLFTYSVTADTLFAYYDMSNSSNGQVIANNSGGPALNLLALQGSGLPVQTQGGPWGPYLHFNGVSAYARHNDGTLITSATFAIEANFRINGKTQYVPGVGDRYWAQNIVNAVDVISIPGTNQYQRYGFDLSYENQSGNLMAVIWLVNDSGQVNEKTIRVPINVGNGTTDMGKWYRASLAWDGTTFSLTLDGQSSVIRANGWHFPPATISFKLGGVSYDKPETNLWNPLNGDIDEVRIWTDFSWLGLDRENTIANLQSDLAYSFDSSPYVQGSSSYFADDTNSDLGSMPAKVTGATWQQSAGVSGGAAAFAGSDYLATSLADPGTVQGISLSTWFRASSATKPKSIAATSDGRYALYLDAGWHLCASINTASAVSKTLCSTSVVDAKVWNLATMVFDGTNFSLYLNGSAAANPVSLIDQPKSGLYTLYLGKNPSQSSSGLSGALDDVHLYNRGLALDEVRRLYRLRAESQTASSYSFNSATYGAAKDAGLSFKPLTLGAGATVDAASGVYNGALKLSRTATSYAVAAGTSSTTVYASGLTVAGWIKLNDIGAKQYLLSTDRDNTSKNNGGFSLAVTTAGALIGAIDFGGTLQKRISTATGLLVADKWYHVAMTFDKATGSLRLYLNGQLKTSVSYAGKSMIAPAYNLAIGTTGYDASVAGSANHLNGFADEIRLGNRAMTASDIALLAMPYRVSSTPPIRNQWILPTQPVWDAWPAEMGINIDIANGEYEAASLMVEASRALGGSPAGDIIVSTVTLPAALPTTESNTVRLVKAWFQCSGDDIVCTGIKDPVTHKYTEVDKELKPELLLNDPALVTVDESTSTNIVNNIAWPQDALALQAVTVPAGRTQQYWITVNGGSSIFISTTNPISGNISITTLANGSFLVPLTATRRALPLPSPMLHYGLYYHGAINNPNITSNAVSEYKKTEAQYRAEMKNMVAHGVTAPSMHAKPAWGAIDTEMQLRIAAGMNPDHIAFGDTGGDGGLAQYHACATFIKQYERNSDGTFKYPLTPVMDFSGKYSAYGNVVYGPSCAWAGDYPSALYPLPAPAANTTCTELAPFNINSCSVDEARIIANNKYKEELLNVFKHFYDSSYIPTEGPLSGTEVPYPEPYFYGLDEATGELLLGQAGITDRGAIPELGPYYAIQHTMYKGSRAHSTVSVSSGYYEALNGALANGGNLIDQPIMSGCVDCQDDLDQVHAVGNKMLVYGHPQAGIERPFIYRFKNGLWLWAKDLDGSHDYTYQDGTATVCNDNAPCLIWNDFDGNGYYRDHVFAYPTVDGVVDTIQWEGFREGVDDIRYLTALRNRMNTVNPGCFDNTVLCTGKALAAKRYLDRLKQRVLEQTVYENEMNGIRETLYQYTLMI